MHNALFLSPKICVRRGASVVWKYECSQLEIFYFWNPGSSIFTFNHMYSILQYRINIAQFFWDLFFSAFVPDTKKSEHFLLIRTKRISKLSWNFGCLFTFCYSAWANLIKTKLQSCNLQTGQSRSYKHVNQFLYNLPHLNSKNK